MSYSNNLKEKKKSTFCSEKKAAQVEITHQNVFVLGKKKKKSDLHTHTPPHISLCSLMSCDNTFILTGVTRAVTSSTPSVLNKHMHTRTLFTE